ncbi:hypothetical protein KSF78_0005733 [Schistosoma japonicum]|nr:hypothetical protein KSF78_0005733 [Schistosoma japonicum]
MVHLNHQIIIFCMEQLNNMNVLFIHLKQNQMKLCILHLLTFIYYVLHINQHHLIN